MPVTSYVRAVLAGALAIAAATAPSARAADPSHALSPKTQQVLHSLVLADAVGFLEGGRSSLDRYYHRPRPLFMTNEQAWRLASTDARQLEVLTAGKDVLLVGTVVRIVPSLVSRGYRVDMHGGAAELEDDQFGTDYARQLAPGLRAELICRGASIRASAYAFLHCEPAYIAASLMDERATPELLANESTDPTVAHLIANAQRAAGELPAGSACYAAAGAERCMRELADLRRRADANPSGAHPAPPAVADADVFRPPVSVDCGAPASNGQRVLCGDVDLFAREIALRQLFDTVQLAAYTRSVEASKALVAAHAASSAERDACADRACVAAWFDNREAQLAQLAAGPK